MIESSHPGDLLWATRSSEGTKVTLLGYPMDSTTSFQPGARFGPAAVRTASWGLEDYSPELRASVPPEFIYDLGDLVLPFGHPSRALRQIEEAVDSQLRQGRLPFGLGGEHLVSLGAIEATRIHHPDLVVVQLDAHTDLRQDYLGEEMSHATFLYHVGRRIGFDRIFQLGIRSGTEEEFRLGTWLRPDLVAVPEAMARIGTRPVYLTLDIDVADPAFAPGTGTPEPGGATSRELLAAVRDLGRLNIVAADIVEVLPARDTGGITAILAAKCLRELLIRIAKRLER